MSSLLSSIKSLRTSLGKRQCDHRISLICSREALSKRLERDVEAGICTADIIAKSLERMPLYKRLNTVKIDVSEISADQAAAMIALGCYEETAKSVFLLFIKSELALINVII